VRACALRRGSHDAIHPDCCGAGYGSIVIRLRSWGTNFTYDVWSSAVTFNKQAVTVTLPAMLAGTNYTVTVDPTAFVSKVGVYYPGTNEDAWTFLTAGAVAPFPVSVTPADQSVNVNSTVVPRIVFSEYIRRGVGNITLFNLTDGTSYFVDVMDPRVYVSENVFEFRLPLGRGQTYRIQISSGTFQAFSGLVYNGTTSIQQWRFVTEGGARWIDRSTVVADRGARPLRPL
jgi:hypothetical protein